MKKIFSLIIAFTFLTFVASPALAAKKSAPKATGSYDYTVHDVARHADFNAITTSEVCEYVWNVAGVHTMDVIWSGNHYYYTLTLTQTNDVLGGTLHDSYLPGTLAVINGTITGNNVKFSVNYGDGSYQGKRTFKGEIDSSGKIIGDWTEIGYGNELGEWSSNSFATKIFGTGCSGKGTFNYSDVNGTYYTVDVKYVSVAGNEAWFAGPVVSGNMGGYGQYLFIKVVDNGESGIGKDISGGDFPLTEDQASLAVATHATPTLKDIVITGGNIQVH